MKITLTKPQKEGTTNVTLAMNPVEKLWRAALVVTVLVAAALLAWSAARAAPPQQVASCLNTPVSADPSATVCISNVQVPTDDKSEDNGFNVFWRSQASETGSVKLNGGETFGDVRGTDWEGKTHYVRVSDLTPKTSSTFDIVSGGQTYTNGGAHWTVTLGDAAEPQVPYVIIGHVNNADGSGADNAVVFALVRDRDDNGTGGPSALLSARINVADGGDLFNINLEDALTPTFAAQYEFDPTQDRVLINVIGEEGTVAKQFRINELHPPQAPPSLVLSGTGAGQVTTATPTLIPDTATTTPSPSPTATETVEPTNTPRPPRATRTPRPLPTETLEELPTAASSVTAAPATVTLVAMPAEPQSPAERTRVYGGVPTPQAPPPAGNNMLLLIAFAIVLFVGALLLGLAAFFVSRR